MNRETTHHGLTIRGIIASSGDIGDASVPGGLTTHGEYAETLEVLTDDGFDITDWLTVEAQAILEEILIREGA